MAAVKLQRKHQPNTYTYGFHAHLPSSILHSFQYNKKSD